MSSCSKIWGQVGRFANADAVYVLAFSTIILNTDLHNPNLPPNKRMTKEAFLKNNKGINDSQDLPQDYLCRLYDEIREQEIQVDMEITEDGDSLASHLQKIDPTSWHRLIDKSAADMAPAAFTPTVSARQGMHGRTRGSLSSTYFVTPSLQDRDMFLVMAAPVLKAMDSVWVATWSDDDLLVGRVIEGVVDFAAICVSLNLQDALTALVQKLSVRCRQMLQHNSHLAELAKRYGEEDTEATLIYLLGPGFEDMLQGSVGRQRGASRISGSGSSGSSSEYSGS